jgi:hypothetical protein
MSFKYSLASIFALSAVIHLNANSISSIQSLVKSGDFVSASEQIDSIISANPNDSEAHIYKTIVEFGLFFESTLPQHLIDHLNAKADRTIPAFDFDPSLPLEEPTRIPITDSYGSQLGEWTYYEDSVIPLFESNGELYLQNRLFNIFDWNLVSKSGPQFVVENNYFQGTETNSFITFTYSGINAKQCEFSINNNYTNGYLNFYLNGLYMGIISNGYFSYEIGDNFIYGYEDTLPLYLKNGDKVSFELITYGDTSEVFQGPGIMSSELLQGTMSIENGTAYTLAYPNLGETVSIEDILSIITRKELPTRNLISNCIDSLASFQSGDLVELPESFTGYHSDIIIQYEDALFIQSILKLINAFLGLIDQYDLSLSYDYDVLNNLGTYETLKAFFLSYPNVLQSVADRADDQADSKAEILSALEKIEEILPILWYKAPPEDPFKTHLISIADNTDSEDYAKLNEQIDALKASLVGFETFSKLTQESDGGFSFSLQPFLGADAFPIQNLLLNLESTEDGYDFIHGYEEGFHEIDLLIEYGIIKNVLPVDFSGKILIIYNSNGTIHKTVYFKNDNSHDLSPISGEFNHWTSMGDSIFPNGNWSNSTLLSYQSPNAGQWAVDNYMYGNTDYGSFYYYNGNLDLNENGTIDALDILNGTSDDPGYETSLFISDTPLNYPASFTSSQIASKEIQLQEAAPTSLKGLILLYDYSPQYEWEAPRVETHYYISKNDVKEVSGDSYINYKYNYSKGIEKFTEDPYDMNGESLILYNFSTTHTGTFFDGISEYEFAFYPSYLDLDDDGLEDGIEIIAGIAPDIENLPTYSEINSAIENYSSENTEDNSQVDSLGSQASSESNPYALLDSDNDNMPDSLEEKFGGSSSNANDANIALNAILNDTYSLSELSDLRLGSTLYEISEGLASFDIILEESTDLQNWSEYGAYSLELSNDSDENVQFFRFKMAD